MKKILNIFKYIIVPYHCVIKYCFLLISPFLIFYYFFEPFVFDDTKHFLDNFGSSFGLNGIIAWALFLFFFISPAVYYLKSRGITEKEAIKLLSKSFILGNMDIEENLKDMILKIFEDVWR